MGSDIREMSDWAIKAIAYAYRNKDLWFLPSGFSVSLLRATLDKMPCQGEEQAYVVREILHIEGFANPEIHRRLYTQETQQETQPQDTQPATYTQQETDSMGPFTEIYRFPPEGSTQPQPAATPSQETQPQETWGVFRTQKNAVLYVDLDTYRIEYQIMYRSGGLRRLDVRYYKNDQRTDFNNLRESECNLLIAALEAAGWDMAARSALESLTLFLSERESLAARRYVDILESDAAKQALQRALEFRGGDPDARKSYAGKLAESAKFIAGLRHTDDVRLDVYLDNPPALEYLALFM